VKGKLKRHTRYRVVITGSVSPVFRHGFRVEGSELRCLEQPIKAFLENGVDGLEVYDSLRGKRLSLRDAADVLANPVAPPRRHTIAL
jgi:hypothetical protein